MILRSRTVLAVALVCASSATLMAADSGGDLAALTGHHTRVVWVQDAGPTACVYVEKPTVLLMGFDSADGKGERAIVTTANSFYKPLFTADGQRIVYSDHAAHTVCIVPFAGGAPQVVLRDAEHEDVWTDPADGVTWIYAQVGEQRGGAKAGVLRRFRLNQPATSELLWDKTPMGHLQLSGDGFSAAGGQSEGGNQTQGVFHLPNDSYQSGVGGCWPSMCPDDSGRFWVFGGDHRGAHFFLPADGPGSKLIHSTCDFASAPGISRNVEMYHPRWSNDTRFLSLTGPYASFDWAGEAKITNAVAAGVEVYVGRFAADFKSIDGWVQVTHNQRGDYWPDTWIEQPAAKPVVARKAPVKAATAATDQRGLEFTYGDSSTPNQAPAAQGTGIRLCEMTLAGRARYGRYGVIELTGGSASASHGADALAACRASGQFTVEATFTAALQACDPATLLSFAGDDAAALTLLQSAGRLRLRLTTSATPKEGIEQELCELSPGRPHHVAVSYAAGRLRCVIDGQLLLVPSSIAGDLSPWNAKRIVFGADGDRGWSGTVADIAIHSRALDADEVRAHFSAAQEREAKRVRASQVVVEAVVGGRSPAPDPQAIAPYRRSLSLSSYDVDKVVSGTLAAKRIVVAEWSVMDSAILPEYQAVKPGDRRRLVLESLDDRPEQESERQTNALAGIDDLPVFYDVTPVEVARGGARDVAWTAAGNGPASWRSAAGTGWSVPGAPAPGDRVVLGDVASGSRTITSTRPEAIGQLAITQTTAGAANALVVAAPLRIDGSSTPLRVGQGTVLRIPAAPLTITNGSFDDVTLAGASELGGGGGVGGALVIQGGAGYRTAPEVQFAGPGGGASAQATLAVHTLRTLRVGQGYTAAPTVEFSAPETFGGHRPTAVATIDGQGALKGIQLTNGGSGYLAMPTVTLTGGGGSGAAVEALGRVAGIAVLAAGTGYALPPELTLAGGGGHGATVRAFAQVTTFVYDAGQGNCAFTNAGTLTQSGSLLRFDWAADGHNGGNRNYHNTGTWLLTRAMVAYTSSTGLNLWCGTQSGNSGRMALADGSQLAFEGFDNSGTLELGAGSVLSAPGYAMNTVRLRNHAKGVIRVVGSSEERPAVLGCVIPEGNGARELLNGVETADDARLEIGSGTDHAVLTVVGGQVQVANGAAARLTVAAGATLALLTNDNGSTNNFTNRQARLDNAGQLTLAGTVRFQSNHGGGALIANGGTMTLAGEAVFERLPASAGESAFYSPTGTPSLVLIGASGRLDGAGALRYRNRSGRAEVATLGVEVVGLIAPGGGSAGKAAAITFVDAALALGVAAPVQSEHPSTGAGSATVAIRIFGAADAKDPCDQVVVRTEPGSGAAAALVLASGVGNTLDVHVAPGVKPRGAYTVLRAPTVTGTFANLRCNGAEQVPYTVRYAPTTVEVVFP